MNLSELKKMRWPRGTVLRWTPKALKKLGDKADASERMIVLDGETAVLFKGREVEELALLKSHDSFVTPAEESVPTGLTYSRILADRDFEDAVCKEFGIQITAFKTQIEG